MNIFDRRFTYFVSFSHSKGFGNIEIGRLGKIKTIDDIRAVEKAIDEHGVVILEYKLLSKFIGKK